jgi:hypothetical protein
MTRVIIFIPGVAGSSLYTPENEAEVGDVNNNSYSITGNRKLWLKWHSMINNNPSDSEAIAMKNADENQTNFSKLKHAISLTYYANKFLVMPLLNIKITLPLTWLRLNIFMDLKAAF